MRDDFLKALVSLQARFLVTSRPSIAPYLLQGAPYIEMGDQNQKDIELFIDPKIKESTNLMRVLRRDEQIWSQIRAKLKETSKSMYANLHATSEDKG